MWDPHDLETVKVTYSSHTHYTIGSSDKLSDKLELLELDSSQKINILSDLITLGGSANLLSKKENTSQNSISSVQIYSCHRAFSKSLIMQQLGKGKIRYPDQAKTGVNGSATHVVIGIEYGADTTFILRKQIERKKNRLEVESQLQACGKKNLLTNYRNWLQYNPKKMQISQ